MREKAERIFAMTLGPQDVEIPDRILRKRVEDCDQSVKNLMSLANVSGQFGLTHGCLDGNRVLNVDASSTLKRKLDLFEGQANETLLPKDAATRVINTAREALRQIMADGQVTAARVQKAVPSQRKKKNLVVDALLRQPEQRLDGSSREGDFSLELQTNEGYRLQDGETTVVGRLLQLGKVHGKFRIDFKQTKGLQARVRGEICLQIPRADLSDERMMQVFGRWVLSGEAMTIRVKFAQHPVSGVIVAAELQGDFPM